TIYNLSRIEVNLSMMAKTVKKDIKTFPLRLEYNFSKEIDALVFYTDSPSKHQYILDAINEKMSRDRNSQKMRERQA
ncbi:hypothetical protein M5X02_32105, partial [Paenibacillus alvei]|uniref:hypothetical protein n=2 Tax=Paenibacillus alvei TaxID=44250 RepID=UPI0022832F6B